MPDLPLRLGVDVGSATDLVKSAESARVALTRPADRNLLHVSKLELLYELAFLRAFVSWETFLEDSFLRYMCGYTTVHGQAALAGSASYSTTIRAARLALYAGQDYLLWHNPDKIVRRSQRIFSSGKHEMVVASIRGTLSQFAAVRHRIAHGQTHARLEFDLATMSLAGRRYAGSRPGRFLRDWVPGLTPPTRWLYSITSDLLSLSRQICPT